MARSLVFDQLEVDLSALKNAEIVRVMRQQRSLQLEGTLLTLAIMGTAKIQLTFRQPTRTTGDHEMKCSGPNCEDGCTVSA